MYGIWYNFKLSFGNICNVSSVSLIGVIVHPEDTQITTLTKSYEITERTFTSNKI